MHDYYKVWNGFPWNLNPLLDGFTYNSFYYTCDVLLFAGIDMEIN